MVGGNLPIFLIKLFGQDGELLDLLHAGHGLIHVSHFTLDQFYDLRTPGQVLVSGKLDFVILGIFHHVVLINHDQTTDKFPFIPYHHSVINIRAEFQLVFDVLRGNILATGRMIRIRFLKSNQQKTKVV